MTDEQILKRLAEIEGWVSFAPDPDEWYRKDSKVELDDETYCYTFSPVDPLTNWSDLGPLIEKYRLQIEPPSKFEEDCFSIRELWTVCAYDSNDGAKSESLPHAICLAIIEANGGMGDE